MENTIDIRQTHKQTKHMLYFLQRIDGHCFYFSDLFFNECLYGIYTFLKSVESFIVFSNLCIYICYLLLKLPLDIIAILYYLKYLRSQANLYRFWHVVVLFNWLVHPSYI